jgi:hypothetical protein
MHFVSEVKVNVELGERSTVEARINWKSRASLWSLIELRHRLADLEHEEVGQSHRRGGQESLAQ